MKTNAKSYSCLLALTLFASVGNAQDPSNSAAAPDKSQFNLFNPTPAAFLRAMTTDGPGATESAYTVDAGHFQIEMSFIDYTSVRQTFQDEEFLEDFTYHLDWLAIAPFNLRIGLLNSLEVQLVLEPYNQVYEREDEGDSTKQRGFGNTTVRLKYNVWGNDHGRTALALTPFVRIPTSQDGIGSDIVEYGVAIPFAAELPWDFFLGLTSRFVSAQDILGGKGRHTDFANSIDLTHQIIGDLDGYIEFFSNVSTEEGVGWVGTFDTGLIYWLTDNLQLNAGVNIGVTEWADDWRAFAGIAWRF